MKNFIISESLGFGFAVSAVGSLYSAPIINGEVNETDWTRVRKVHENDVLEIESIVTQLVDNFNHNEESHAIDTINDILHNQIEITND